MASRMRMFFGVLALALTVGACEMLESGNGVTGPSEGTSQVNASNPASLDTFPRSLVDGLGMPGPLQIELKSIWPDLYSRIVSGMSANFEAEVRMDAIPNPRNSRFLAEMQIRPIWSEDGQTPMGSVSNPYLSHFSIGNGEQKKISGPVSIAFPISRNARQLMFVANWGPNQGRWGPNPEDVYEWSNEPCPSPEDIARMNSRDLSRCLFRTSYDLGYQW